MKYLRLRKLRLVSDRPYLKKRKKEKNPCVLTDVLKKYPFETDGNDVFKNNLKIKIFIADGYKQSIKSN